MTTWGSRPTRPARALAPLLLAAALTLNGCSGGDETAEAQPDAREAMQEFLDASAAGDCARATDLVVVDRAETTEGDVREQCESRPEEYRDFFDTATIEAVEVDEPTEGLGEDDLVDNGQDLDPPEDPELNVEAAAAVTLLDANGGEQEFDLVQVGGDWLV